MADFSSHETPTTAAKMNTVLPAGVRVVLDQAAAPPGWARDTGSADDRLLRVIASGSRTDGGTWEIAGMQYAGGSHSHTLATAGQTDRATSGDQGAPSYGYALRVNNMMVRGRSNVGEPTAPVLLPSTDSVDTTHTHAFDGSWRPSFRDVGVFVRQASPLGDFVAATAARASHLNSVIASGSRAAFDQNAAPLGWAVDASGDDRVLRVRAGTAKDADGGTWLIAGMYLGGAVHAHVLLTSGIGTVLGADVATLKNGVPQGPLYHASGTLPQAGAYTDYADSSHTHGFDGSWRPPYRVVRLCARQTADWTVSEGVTSAKLNTFVAAGTRMVFDQDVAPNGWTRAVDVNDRVLLHKPSVSGQTTGGAWTLSGMQVSGQGHSHGFASGAGIADSEQGAPLYLGNGGTIGFPGITGDAGRAVLSGRTDTVAGAHTHGFDGAWRPAYHDCIVCVRS